LPAKWICFVGVATPRRGEGHGPSAGADAIIAHVGTTIGGSIGVKKAVVSMDETVKRCQSIIDGAEVSGAKGHHLPLSPARLHRHAGRRGLHQRAHGLRVGSLCMRASSSRTAGSFEDLLTQLTQRFKQAKIPVRHVESAVKREPGVKNR
jgi:hypothetical protein